MGGQASKADVEKKREAGKIGGRARAEAMPPERRREMAIRAVQARQAKEEAMTPEQRQELKEQRQARARLAVKAREAKRKAAKMNGGGDEA